MSKTWLAVVVAVAAWGSTARAQGWAEDKGTLSAGLSYGYQWAAGVYHGGVIVTGTDTNSHQVNLEAEYVPLDRLTVGLQVYSAANRYTGTISNPAVPNIIFAHGENDMDGKHHYAITDGEVELRYAILNERFGLSPSLRFMLPLTDYEVRGYAGHGTGLYEIGAGLHFNMSEVLTENGVLGASYGFTYVQAESQGGTETEALRTHRSDIMLAYGYSFTEKISASLAVGYRLTHGGITLDELPMASMNVRMWHDPILKRDFLTVNALGSYALTDSLSTTLGFAIIPLGDNVSNAKTLSMNLAWTMRP